VAVREDRVEVRLELGRTTLDVPGAVDRLGLHQVLHTLLINRIAYRHTEFVHGIERESGGVGVAGQVGSLTPAAV